MVKESEKFHRQGEQISGIQDKIEKEHDFSVSEVIVITPVTVSQAALGSDIIIETLDGEENLMLPAGAQSGDIHKISGKKKDALAGVPSLRSYGRGDMICQIIVQIPKKMSQRQEELYRELAEEDGGGG